MAVSISLLAPFCDILKLPNEFGVDKVHSTARDVGTCTSEDLGAAAVSLSFATAVAGDSPGLGRAAPILLTPRKRVCVAVARSIGRGHALLEDPNVLARAFSCFIGRESADEGGVRACQRVCRQWRAVISGRSLWQHQPWERSGTRALNWSRFENLGTRSEGTEGLCVECKDRATGRTYALKQARVFPHGEGVPYYMLRELAVLRRLKHPNVVALQAVSLRQHRLHLFFDYVPSTLHSVLNAPRPWLPAHGGGQRSCFGAGGGRPIPMRHLRRLLKQLLEAVAHIHSRGVIHRNIKPKHLLLQPGPSPADPLEGATLRLSDFALVRLIGPLPRTYTHEVVTLWYRAPEVLMGVRDYGPGVDIWSVGCVFTEMAHGRPPFTGFSEIDQLFQIFNRLDTPTSATWPAFRTLPNFSDAFPDWKNHDRARAFPLLAQEPAALDLLEKMFAYEPSRRIAAVEALRHSFFAAADVVSRESEAGAARVLFPRRGVVSGADAAERSSAVVMNEEAEAPLVRLGGVASWGGGGSGSDGGGEEASVGVAEQRLAGALPCSDSAEGVVLEGSGDCVLPDSNEESGNDSEVIDIMGGVDLELAAEATSLQPALSPKEAPASPCGISTAAAPASAPQPESEWLSTFWDNLCDAEQQAMATTSNPPAACGCCRCHCNSNNSSDAAAPAACTRTFPRRSLSPLRAGMRATLVDWLAEIVEVYQMCERSVFAATALVDRYLQCQPATPRERWQLLGATCLHVASKLEDVSYISIDDLAHCADGLYEPRQVLEMEEQVLNELDFEISLPTIFDFASAALARRPELAANSNGRAARLTVYLAELSLQDEGLAAMPPSAVALACVGRARWLLGLGVGPPPPLRHGVTVLRECSRLLHSLHRAAPVARLQVVRRRHLKPERLEVAAIESPAVLFDDWDVGEERAA